MIKTKQRLLSSKRLIVSFYVFVFCLTLTRPVYAYLDSGTFSILFQSLLAGLATAIVSISLFWQKIRNFLFGNKKKDGDEEQTEEQD